MTLPQCSACLNFKKGKPHICRLTRHSCLWERAAMIQGDPPIQQFDRGKTRFVAPLYIKDYTNCGYEAKFYEAKS